jgi:molybdate transport system substrate-binding protein
MNAAGRAIAAAPTHVKNRKRLPMSEITVLSTTAMKTSMDALMPEFQRSSGHSTRFSYAPSARIAKQVADGESNDVAIVTGPGIEDLIRQGRIVAGSRTDIARSAMGLAVQKGSPRPDISTAEKFKQAMLAAKSLGMSNPVGGGQSGANLMKIFDTLGITEAMMPKLTFGPGGPAGLIGNFLLRKEVEIGIQQIPELMAVPGIDIIGPLPDEIQSMTTFAVGLSTAARNPDAGRALMAFLSTPVAAKVMMEKGMQAP